MRKRYAETIQLLTAWAPMTVEAIFRAGRAFESPFSSLRRCRDELQLMHGQGLVGRCAIPDTGRGQKPLAYHLSRRAASLVPSVASIPKSNTVFHGLGRSPWHALALAEFWSIFEGAVADQVDLTILERVRDRQFVASLKEHPKLVPDGSVLLETRGRRKLIFLELVNETGVINPGAEASRTRSLFNKLARYRAFREVRKQHPTWQFLERTYGEIGGFQVLVVTTRANVRYLLSAADGSNTMFLFGELSELRAAPDIFENPVWWLPRSPWRRQGPERTRLIVH
jgi:hypothetical protein